jgi:hypothetical protein
MMDPAEDRYRCDAAELLGSPTIWSILIQREMSSDLVVIRSISLQDTAQMRLAEHDEVVERFAPDRSDKPLNVAVLPW